MWLVVEIEVMYKTPSNSEFVMQRPGFRFNLTMNLGKTQEKARFNEKLTKSTWFTKNLKKTYDKLTQNYESILAVISQSYVVFVDELKSFLHELKQ